MTKVIICVFILNRNVMPEVFCPIQDAPLSLVRVLIENEFRTVHSRKKDHSTFLCRIAVTLTLWIFLTVHNHLHFIESKTSVFFCIHATNRIKSKRRNYLRIIIGFMCVWFVNIKFCQNYKYVPTRSSNVVAGKEGDGGGTTFITIN